MQGKFSVQSRSWRSHQQSWEVCACQVFPDEAKADDLIGSEKLGSYHITWFLVVCQWSRHLARPKLHPSKTAWSLRSSWAPSISQHHPGWIKSWNTNHTKDEKSTLREGMQCSWLLGSDFDLYTQATNPEECRRNEHSCSNMRTRGHLTRLVNLTPLNSKHPGYTWPTQVNIQDPNLAKGLEANIFFWTLLVSIWHLVTSLLMGKGQLDSYSWLPHPSFSWNNHPSGVRLSGICVKCHLREQEWFSSPPSEPAPRPPAAF